MAQTVAPRNWAEICKIGAENNLLMAVLATIDPTSWLGSRLAKAFPECFTGNLEGPVPLSVLRRHAHEYAAKHEVHYTTDLGELLESYGALESFQVPYLEYGLTEEAVHTWGVELVPDRSWRYRAVGDTVTFLEGDVYVVVENNQNDGVGLIYLAPANRVAVDL
ncbi:hypothetical protein HY375_00555 [Candidatus Berkelbacteria bacterium]|nr:hypothetical protein [Candidatus Berkelbacteria bacterium]